LKVLDMIRAGMLPIRLNPGSQSLGFTAFIAKY
jgi:hypothetical protein